MFAPAVVARAFPPWLEFVLLRASNTLDRLYLIRRDRALSLARQGGRRPRNRPFFLPIVLVLLLVVVGVVVVIIIEWCASAGG